MRRTASRRPVAWPTLIVEVALLLVATWFVLRLNPTGFGGGPFDDQRYFDSARAWLAHPPLVGGTHWELRHPLILPLAVLFRIIGTTIATALWVPIMAALAFAAINFAAIRQAGGSRGAWVWALLLLTTPLFVRIGTSIFPEIVELLFTSMALWALWFGREARRPALLFALSGLCTALAILTRETAAWLILVPLFSLAFRPGTRRIDYAWIFAFAAGPLLIEWAWLFWATGDPLYRLHVGMHHVLIPSANMQGGVAHVDHVLFNPAVGRLWLPPGLFHLHWALNPLLGLFADPKYGAAIWAAILFALVPTRGQRRKGAGRSALIMPVLLVGMLSFGFVTYVLMVSQDQRYYALPLACIAVVAGILADRQWQAGRRALVTIVVGMVVLGNLALASQLGRFDRVANAAVPLVRSASGPVHMLPVIAAQLRQPLADAGLADRVTTSPARRGELLLVVQDGRDCFGADRFQPGRRLIGCRVSDPPRIIRWVRLIVPRGQLPDRLSRGGSRALLVRVTA